MPVGKPLTPTHEAVIQNLRNQGYTIREIAAAVGVARSTVAKRVAGNTWAREQQVSGKQAQVVELREQGVSFPLISLLTGYSICWIQTLCKRYSVEKPRSNPLFLKFKLTEDDLRFLLSGDLITDMRQEITANVRRVD